MPVKVQMRKSQLFTAALPVIGVGNPAILTHAGDSPQRVVVRNIGASIVFVAHKTSDLEQLGSTQGTWQIPVGGVDTFVVAPEQQLYASAAGPNGMASIAISDAVPWFLEG